MTKNRFEENPPQGQDSIGVEQKGIINGIRVYTSADMKRLSGMYDLATFNRYGSSYDRATEILLRGFPALVEEAGELVGAEFRQYHDFLERVLGYRYPYVTNLPDTHAEFIKKEHGVKVVFPTERMLTMFRVTSKSQ
jgi:hypothetical protein